MGSRLSLANKCLAIFGAVISIIIVVMLSIPWTRTATLIHNYQEELASQLAEEWLLAGDFGSSEDDDASLDILVFI
jgi:ubiquinone biosynthesis protein UbiJ